MALLHYLWSRVAASNATADANINFQEGQAPSSVNDSARALMASAAGFRDDIAGAIVTGGTSTNYTISSYQVFDTLAHMDKMVIAFTPHTANGATVTLNVDGLGAKPLRLSPNVELQTGSLITGTPYAALYNNSDAAWYLFGALGSNPYNVPLASGMDYWGSTAPNSAFAFPSGQAISRTTYATLFSLIGTAYGSGNGSTTFNLPDKTGRVSAMKEASNARLTPTYFGSDSTVLGAGGGSESHALTTAELASHSHANSLNDAGHSHSITGGTVGGTSAALVAAGSATSVPVTGTAIVVSSAGTGMTITNASAGSGSAHTNVPPTIICNYIIRVI